MYIDRIRINWDKVSPDSYLTRIPAIGLLQELSEQVANFAEGAVTKLRSQHSIALEMVVFAITNRFKENAPQTYASKYVVIPDGTADHRIWKRSRSCQRASTPSTRRSAAARSFWSDIPKTTVR